MTKDKSIFIKNIYYMLSYAFQALNQMGLEDIDTEDFDRVFSEISMQLNSIVESHFGIKV